MDVHPLRSWRTNFLAAFLSRRRAHEIQDVPVLLSGPPQRVRRALAGQKDLVERPFVPGPRPAPPERMGIGLAKLPALRANRFGSEGASAFQESLFDGANAQAEPAGPPHRRAEDLHRKAVSLICYGSGRCVQAVTVPYGVELNKLTMPVDHIK